MFSARCVEVLQICTWTRAHSGWVVLTLAGLWVVRDTWVDGIYGRSGEAPSGVVVLRRGSS